jgi:hypothetical protein
VVIADVVVVEEAEAEVEVNETITWLTMISTR